MTLTASLLPGVPLVDSPFFDTDAPTVLSNLQMSVAAQLRSKGYAVIDFPDSDIFDKIEGIKRDFEDKYDWAAWRAGKLNSLRIQDAWRSDDRVRDIAVNDEILKLLSAIYGRQAVPFQTLNFAVGTQQAAHSDHAHFNSVPDRFMCGVWLAFEDTDEENGPLFYYPGSHLWPSYQNEHLGATYSDLKPPFPTYEKYVRLWDALAKQQGLRREIFHAKKGQALIWTSNLLHGGSAQADLSRTRWSQVTHYFFEGCAYTTPIANDTYQGKIHYRNIVDIRSGERVPNIVSGQPVRQSFQDAIDTGFEVAASIKNERLRHVLSKIETSQFAKDRTLPRDFDPILYVEANPDLIAAQVDPFEHYLNYGRMEGRPIR